MKGYWVSMARSNRPNSGRRDKSPKNNKKADEDQGSISRLTREFRTREHMSYPSQTHPGDEELCRHLRTPYRRIVLGAKGAT